MPLSVPGAYSVAVVFPSTEAVVEMWEELKHGRVYAKKLEKDISERSPKHRTA